MMLKRLIALILLASCSQVEPEPQTTARAESDESVFSLYRDNVFVAEQTGTPVRIHIATFDANDIDENYNQKNCEQVRQFYTHAWKETHRTKPDYYSNFWCEKGRSDYDTNLF